MPTILPVTDIITIGDISTYLSANYTSKKSLFGGSVIKPQPPQQIAYITDALRWGVEGGAETDENNRAMANYLYWLCGYFQLQAQYIMNGPGGGSVVPTPAGGGNPNDIDFIVSDTSIIATGEGSIYLDGTNGHPDLRGYDIDFFRAGQPNYTTPQPGGAVYYFWNSVTGFFQLLPSPGGEATEGEPMRISPKTGGGLSVVPASSIYPLVITSANFEPDQITYNNAAIVGDQYMLFVSGYNSEWQFAGVFFNYTATGFVVIASGWQASNFGNIIIQKIN